VVKRIPTSAFATSFRRRLLTFYDTYRRALPWRESLDPYRVLVSEVMLQQTRVETVIPYYERWLQRFPHIQALATAPLDDVLKQWEGLGYYARARNLQRAAQMVYEQYHGMVPAAYQQLRELPGLGDYTASAVASMAFSQPHAAVDGNVRRVLSRILDLDTATPAELQKCAARLLDPHRPGDFNQAMMELGATVCTSRSPACTTCPLRRLCRARRNGTVHLRPAVRSRKPLPTERVNTLVAFNAGEVLVVQRAARGLLGGLWEFPAVNEPDGSCRRGVVTHAFTHKRIDYHVYFTTERVDIEGEWKPLDELTQLAFSTAQRRVAKLALPVLGS
jgi:A/G-specific adenine glycosylase